MAGNRRAAATNNKRGTPAASALLNPNKLKRIYSALVKSRMLQQRLDRSRGTGEEALRVGAALDLNPGDWIVPSRHSAIVNFVRGEPLRKVLSQRREAAGNSWNPALQMSIGAGLALASKTQQKGQVALALGGEELLADGNWEASLKFAAAHKLPIVYVLGHRSSHDLRALAQRCSLPGITVDGTDVVAVYRVIHESIRRARQGYGPTLIEGKLQDEDPLRFMESYLRTRGLWSNSWRDRLIAGFKQDLQRAARLAKR